MKVTFNDVIDSVLDKLNTVLENQQTIMNKLNKIESQIKDIPDSKTIP